MTQLEATSIENQTNHKTLMEYFNKESLQDFAKVSRDNIGKR